MPDYAAAVRGGYSPLAQITISNTSGADPSLPFAGLTGGRVFTLQVKTGTLRINFMGATGNWLEFTPGAPFSDAVDWTTLKTAKIDTTSAFTAVVLLQGTR